MTKSNKGTYVRYIPHFDHPGLYQNICFRLADSLPRHIAEDLVELAEHRDDRRLGTRAETFLNNGRGECLLRDDRVAKIVEDRLLYKDGEDYKLVAWVIMPNHVHALVRLFEGHPMPDFVQAWKSVSAHMINRLLDRQGKLWWRGYYDRYIRDEDHFWKSINYIHDNPVLAGLVEKKTQWRFSSIERYRES